MSVKCYCKQRDEFLGFCPGKQSVTFNSLASSRHFFFIKTCIAKRLPEFGVNGSALHWIIGARESKISESLGKHCSSNSEIVISRSGQYPFDFFQDFYWY